MVTSIVDKSTHASIFKTQSIFQIEHPSVVKLQISRTDIVSSKRNNADLIVQLKSGKVIRVGDFYRAEGHQNDLVLEDHEGRLWLGEYAQGSANFHFIEIESIDPLLFWEDDKVGMLGLAALGLMGAGIAAAASQSKSDKDKSDNENGSDDKDDTDDKDDNGGKDDTDDKDDNGGKDDPDDKDDNGGKDDTDDKDDNGGKDDTDDKDDNGGKDDTDDKDDNGGKDDTDDKDDNGGKDDTDDKDDNGGKDDTDDKDDNDDKEIMVVAYDNINSSELIIEPKTSDVNLGKASYPTLVSLAGLDLKVLSVPYVPFTVAEKHTLDAKFDYGATLNVGVLSDYSVVLQKYNKETKSWGAIEGDAEYKLLDLGLVSGNLHATSELDAGDYRAFVTFKGPLGIGVLGSLKVTGQDRDYTAIGAVQGSQTSGNVIADINHKGEIDKAPDGAVVKTVINEGVTTPLSDSQLSIAGKYGTLVMKADGSYSYTPNATAEAVGKVDVFAYELVHEASGKKDSAQLFMRVTAKDMGLIWNDDEPNLDADTVNAVDNTANAVVNTKFHTETSINSTFSKVSWAVAMGQVVSASASFTVKKGTEVDAQIGVNASNLLSLGGKLSIELYRKEGSSETLIKEGSGGSLLDLIGLLPGRSGIASKALQEGEYIVKVSYKALGVLGSLNIELAESTKYLSQVEADTVTTVRGNVLADDILASSYTKLQITKDGSIFSDVPDEGTNVKGTYGTLTISAHGAYKYTPAANLESIGESDNFTYRLLHPNGSFDDAKLTISLNHGDGPVPQLNLSALPLPAEEISFEGTGEEQQQQAEPVAIKVIPSIPAGLIVTPEVTVTLPAQTEAVAQNIKTDRAPNAGLSIQSASDVASADEVPLVIETDAKSKHVNSADFLQLPNSDHMEENTYLI